MHMRRWIASSLLAASGCLPHPYPDGATAITVRLQLKAYDASDPERRNPRFLEHRNVLAEGNRIVASLWAEQPAYLYFLSCDPRSADRLLPAGRLQSAELSPASLPQRVPIDAAHDLEALPGWTRLVFLGSVQPIDFASCRNVLTAACRPLWQCEQNEEAFLEQIVQSACGDAAPRPLRRGSGDDKQTVPPPSPPPPPPPVRGGRDGRPGTLERRDEVVTLEARERSKAVVSLPVDVCVGSSCTGARPQGCTG